MMVAAHALDLGHIRIMKSAHAPKCAVCSEPLAGRQSRFCSRDCKNRDTNNRNQNYKAQQTRGLSRKREMLACAGSACVRCGYSRNLAALTWHHRVPAEKSFQLDLRNLSNRSQAAIRAELVKCDLLCANCHAETHFPHLAVRP